MIVESEGMPQELIEEERQHIPLGTISQAARPNLTIVIW